MEEKGKILSEEVDKILNLGKELEYSNFYRKRRNLRTVLGQ